MDSWICDRDWLWIGRVRGGPGNGLGSVPIEAPEAALVVALSRRGVIAAARCDKIRNRSGTSLSFS